MEIGACACIAGAPNEATGGSAQALSYIMLAACSLPAGRHSGSLVVSESVRLPGSLPASAGAVGAARSEGGAASSRSRMHDLTAEAKEAKKGQMPRTEAMSGIMDSGNCCLINVSSCSPWSGQVLDLIMSRDGLEEENGRFRMSSGKLEDRNVEFAKIREFLCVVA